MAKLKLPKGKRRVRYVDGYSIRYMTPDLFDIVMVKNGRNPAPFVPADEIWIDRCYERETQFLLEVLRIELSKRFRGLPYRSIRRALRKLLKPAPIPRFVVRQERHGGIKVKYVKGEIIRQHLDPAFVFGGHDLIYPYVPEKEIWIDIRQDERELAFTLMHELHERAFMARGLSYDEAHDLSIASEMMARVRKFIVH